MKKFVGLLIIISFSFAVFGQKDYKFRSRLSFSMDPLFAPFYHGVASGDPLSNAVIIWTRITPLGPVDSILVEWEIGLDTLFTQVINSGSLYTKDTRDYTVKVDVTGLQPDTWYYYRFKAFNTYSLIGRTRTFPIGDCDSLRIANISGTNYNNGYFNSIKLLSIRNDIDAIMHTGDYIYEYGTHEYGTHADRELSPNWEVKTLSDYRMRYGHYRLDPDFRYAHQQYPWIVIWDDHETANNSYKDGAENHTPGTEGNWADRKNAGIQAFLEWIPIREINDPTNPDNHIHRTIPVGDLANLIMLDTRLEGRDDPEHLGIDDQSKTMLGQLQYNWFTSELYRSQFSEPVKWKIVGNQVMMAPLEILGNVLNKDQWDGYRFERQKVLNIIYGWDIKNIVILTGDIHTSWANDVPNQSMGPYGSNGQGSGTVEFVTPSITSPSTSLGGGIGAAAITAANPHIKWVELEKRGYYILDINKNRCQADWYFTNDIDNYGTATESHGAAWYVNENERFIRQASIPAIRIYPNPAFAPAFPILVSKPEVNQGLFSLLSVNPNPFQNYIAIQFYSRTAGQIHIELISFNGKTIAERNYQAGKYDLDYAQLSTENIQPGTYLLKITDNNGYSETRKVIKLK